MHIKKVGLIWTFSFGFALLAMQVGCSRSETPAESKSAATVQPAQTPAPALEAAKTPAATPVPAPKKRAPKAAPKTAPAVAKATPPEPTAPRITAAPPPKPQLKTVVFEAGTPLKIRTTSKLSTDSQNTGDTFAASLDEPLARDGWVVAEKGATVEGRILASDKGGRVQGTAHLDVVLDRLQTADGQSIRVSTRTVTVQAKSTKGKDAAKIGIGAGIGALIGGIAGGGKGAGIGAATGAGAGTAVVLSTRGDAAEIASESLLSFELSSPVTITEKQVE